MFARISFFTVNVIEKRRIIQDMVIEIEKKIRNVPFLLLLKDLRELIILFNSKRGGDSPSPLFFLYPP